jgi:ribosomal protein L35
MPGKARPGKQKTHKGAAKRAKKTATGKFTMEKASHRHRLHPKNKRQLNLGGQRIEASKGESKKLKVLLNS